MTTQSTNPGPSSHPILRAANLRKTYRLGRVDVPVLHGVACYVAQGEWLTILGASGSGKSTLLHLLGGLDKPDKPNSDVPRATIEYAGRDLAQMSAGERDRYRATDVGFVFQFYHLLPELTVLENVCIGAMIRCGRFGYMGERSAVHERAESLLKTFGLSHRLKHRSSQLSGGERQRVAIARALINEPKILLADEPTGNLDRETGSAIIDAIEEIRNQFGLTLVMVTHDSEVAKRADRVVRLADGLITPD